MEDVYQALAKRLDELPNGFPATENGIELKILEKIFSPEEARMALDIRIIPETAEAMADRLGKPLDEMQTVLDTMVAKGQIGSAKMQDQQVYFLVPFVVGIYEFQLDRMDKELADMVEEYAPALMPALGNHAPAVTRVVPLNIEKKIEHQVQRYEDIREMIQKAKSFQVVDCICRKERALQGHPCSHTLETCLAISNTEGAFDRYPRGRIITRDETLDILRKSEEEGLVHTTYNVMKGSMFICNCCSCCCGLMIGMKRFNAPFLMASSSFVAIIDQDLCAACGLCADERCPMAAISESQGVYMVDPQRCIGCGVCTNTCPEEAITLIPKPEEEKGEPPANILEWYFKRAENRGISLVVN